MNSHKLLLTCLLAITLFIAFSFSMTNAQMCASNTTAAACPDCKVCTGPSLSCCNAEDDATRGSGYELLQVLAGSSCVTAMKEYGCASCDPKNQKFISARSGLAMCKSKCLSIKSACGSFSGSIDCTSLTDSNCWNSANSLQIHQVVVVAVVAFLSFVMF